MPIPIEVVIVALAFPGVVLIGAGLFGRPDQSLPRCAGCRADARPFAWNEPMRCTCGAALDRPGAVRTRGRIRRPRLAILGALLWIVATVFAVETTRMRRGSPPLLGHLPTAFLLDRVDAGDEWALSVLDLRSKDPGLTPEDAGELLRGLLQNDIHPGNRSFGWIFQRVYHRWQTTTPDAQVTISMLSPASIDDASVQSDQLECEIDCLSSIDPWGLLYRIETVTINDHNVEWSLARAPSAVHSASGKRTFRGSARLRATIPPNTAPGALVEVTMTGVLSRAALGLILDERANAPTAPLAWPVPVATATVTVRASLPFPSASDSTDDKRNGESR